MPDLGASFTVRPAPAGDEPEDPALDHLLHAPTPMSRVAPDGTILWANAAELALLGLQADEYVGRNVRSFHVDAPSAPALLEAIASGVGTREQPIRLRAQDGSIRHVLVDVSVRIRDGRPVYGRCTMRDITDRARVAVERQTLLERALASETPFSRTTDGYLHFDRDWRITFAQLNAAPERSTAIVGKTLWELYPDVRGSEFEQHYRAAMEDRKPRTFQAYYAPQGMWLENRLYPAGDGLALFYRDVSWQRDLERQLAERSRQQAAVARLGHLATGSQPVGVLLQEAVATVAEVLRADMAGIMEVVPEGFRVGAAAGYPGITPGLILPRSALSQSVYTLEQGKSVVVDDLAQETRFIPSPLLLARGGVSGMTVPMQGPDGPYGVLGVHAKEARRFTQDDVHFTENVVNLLSNALQRARADEALRASHENLEQTVAERTAMLERSNREMEAFNYTVSHDLRSPLRNIGGFAGLLAHRYGSSLPPEAQQILDRVRVGVQRMGELIEVLLDLARLHRVDLRRSDVDLSALAESIGAELRATGRHDVVLRVAPGLRAVADPTLARLILVNLLSNAWKFTRRAERPVVEVTAAPVADGPGFVVRDNGAGFDMAHAASLFEPFHRLHSPGDFEGTGIGLATVRRIVERHGGRVWADARPDQGATFGFTLPPPPAPRVLRPQ